MTRFAGVPVALGLVLALAMSPRAWLEAEQRPTFQSATDMVAVDVTVRDGGGPVRGLVAADFQLTDNGVRQRVDLVDAAAMPVDVTLIVDLSWGTGGVMTSRLSAADLRAEVRENTETILATLRPTDRLQVLASDAYVTELLPMQPVADVRVSALAEPPSVLGLASTYDALAAAMVREGEPDRRHLVVAWVKPVDTVSVTDSNTVREIASRTDVVLHVVERDVTRRPPITAGNAGDEVVRRLRQGAGAGATPDGAPAAATPVGGGGLPSSTPRPPNARDLIEADATGGRYLYRTWRPHVRIEPALLPELATIGGGTHRSYGAFRDPSAAGEFRQIFDEFRQGYVLRYRPTGVRPEGRHTIAVTVPRYPNAEIRARRGYTIDPAPRAAASPPAPARPPGAPQAVADLVALFERTDPRAFQASVRPLPNLRRLIDAYRDGGTPLPASPRLEAVLALEVATAGLLASSAEAKEAGEALLAAQHLLVRDPIEADAFECGWYRAANAALQASYLARTAIRMADDALRRCPSDGQLHLARAIATDQLSSLRPAARQADRAGAAIPDSAAVLASYDAVISAHPDVAAEARVRAAWSAYRSRQDEQALALLSAVPASTGDVVLDYYHHLVEGQVLRRLNRVDEAAMAYRRALTAWPGAQAARVALMTLLVESGQRAAAEAMSETVQAAPADQIDPWWVYWQGDYRSFSVQVQRLREMAR